MGEAVTDIRNRDTDRFRSEVKPGDRFSIGQRGQLVKIDQVHLRFHQL